MRRPIKTRKELEAASNHFLRRNPGYPLGVTLAELDYLRGWKDDFLGDALHEQYTSALVGVGSTINLLGNIHGGAVRLTSGPGAAREATLWLGDAAGGFSTFDANEGWVQMALVKLNNLADIIIYICGTATSTLNRRIIGRYDSAFSPNWVLQTVDAGGTTNTNTGLAADTNWHWHALWARPIVGGRQVDYFIDGSLRATTQANIHIGVMTPLLKVYSRAAVSKIADWDYWAAIPRN